MDYIQLSYICSFSLLILFHHDKLGTSPTKFMVFWNVEWYSLIDVSEEPSSVLIRIEELS